MPKCQMSSCRNTDISKYKNKMICKKCIEKWILEETQPKCYLCESEYWWRVDEGDQYDCNTNPEYAHDGGQGFFEGNQLKKFICGTCNLKLNEKRAKKGCEICIIAGKHGNSISKIKNINNKNIIVCNNCFPKVQEIMNVLST